jgi:hypothetical protein
MVCFKGAHVEKDIILTCMRWYVAYPLRDRQLEERMQERGVAVDHATINRWVLRAYRSGGNPGVLMLSYDRKRSRTVLQRQGAGQSAS